MQLSRLYKGLANNLFCTLHCILMHLRGLYKGLALCWRAKVSPLMLPITRPTLIQHHHRRCRQLCRQHRSHFLCHLLTGLNMGLSIKFLSSTSSSSSLSSLIWNTFMFLRKLSGFHKIHGGVTLYSPSYYKHGSSCWYNTSPV